MREDAENVLFFNFLEGTQREQLRFGFFLGPRSAGSRAPKEFGGKVKRLEALSVLEKDDPLE